jgi:hypothetical protein
MVTTNRHSHIVDWCRARCLSQCRLFQYDSWRLTWLGVYCRRHNITTAAHQLLKEAKSNGWVVDFPSRCTYTLPRPLLTRHSFLQSSATRAPSYSIKQLTPNSRKTVTWTWPAWHPQSRSAVHMPTVTALASQLWLPRNGTSCSSMRKKKSGVKTVEDYLNGPTMWQCIMKESTTGPEVIRHLVLDTKCRSANLTP